MPTGKQIDPAGGICRRVALPAADIEVRLARLDASANTVAHCSSLLSPDEKARVERFHFEADRRRFTVARATLRTLLGHATGLAPNAIVFGQTQYGKPYARNAPATIHFNIAHSGDLALYALSRTCMPGVDLEYLHRAIDGDAVARRFFSRREYAELQRIPAGLRQHAFLTCWTRKEAIVKALGKGLRLPLDEIEVTIDPDVAPQALAVTGTRVAQWALYNVDAGPDHVATLAAYRPQG